MLSFAFALLMQVPQPAAPPSDPIDLTVDLADHRVAGRSRVACSSASMEGGMHHHSANTEPDFWLQFRWPVDGWARGFHLVVRDDSNHVLPASRIHHLVLANMDRRQLVHPAVERLLAIGSETEDVMLPKLVGVPLERGTRLALKVACHAAL